MIVYILIAIFNGMVLGASRVINGRLSTERGPLKASLCNHLVGFLFLTLVLLAVGKWNFAVARHAPLSAYCGGFMGAMIVAVNSYVYPRIGAMNGALFVIGGQMTSSVLLDYSHQHVGPSGARCLGVVVLLFGVYLTRISSARREAQKA